MRQSQLFTKTRKESPKDEVSKNANLLIRAGFINKEMSGVYDLLPLGLRVLNKIVGIIREEMNLIGGQEIFMSALQRPELWGNHFNQSRWNDDVWFKTKLYDGSDLGLSFTHEEPISNMLEQFISSYKDLPFYVYQFQTKFRNEKRAQSGVMRTREFMMKDLYSFSTNDVTHNEFYRKVTKSYETIFKRVGLGDFTYMTFASGGSFAKYSHEFQTITEAGEDIIYIDEIKKLAVNKEVVDDEGLMTEMGFDKSRLVEKKAVEVGNIFTLSTKYSDPHLTFKGEDGIDRPVFMGSYGIGPARLMGTVVEVLSDDKGIVWPVPIAPFQAHLIEIIGKNGMSSERAKTIYVKLSEKMEVLYDDRDARAGEKFADADLIGIPYQIIVSERGEKDGTVEIKKRATGETMVVPETDILSKSLDSFFK